MPQKKGASRNGPRLFVQLSDLLLAATTGRTALGGAAARCGRCLDRRCKPERDYSQQQNYPELIHGFSPCENQIGFCRPMGMPSALESRQSFQNDF
jgi:hypothetical protein